jgi:multiple antibiotic resistance protein
MEPILITYIIALLAVLDPIGCVPFFLGATGNIPNHIRIKTALALGVFITATLIMFLFTGTALLDFFGITMPAFQIAGGIILLLTGLKMVEGTTVSHEHAHIELPEVKGIVARIIVPIGVPLFVGPGSISTVVLYASKATNIWDYVIATVIVCVICTFILATAGFIKKILGNTGLDITTRILGLIITAIAVQFMLDGLKVAFKM